MRVPKAPNQSPLEVIATPPERGRNKVAADFPGSRFPVGYGGGLTSRIGLVRSVRPAVPPGSQDVEVMLEAGEKLNGPVWAETDLGALNNAYQYILNLEARRRLEA